MSPLPLGFLQFRCDLVWLRDYSAISSVEVRGHRNRPPSARPQPSGLVHFHYKECFGGSTLCLKTLYGNGQTVIGRISPALIPSLRARSTTATYPGHYTKAANYFCVFRVQFFPSHFVLPYTIEFGLEMAVVRSRSAGSMWELGYPP